MQKKSTYKEIYSIMISQMVDEENVKQKVEVCEQKRKKKEKTEWQTESVIFDLQKCGSEETLSHYSILEKAKRTKVSSMKTCFQVLAKSFLLLI